MKLDSPLLPTPENLEVQEGLSQLTISYRWMKPMYYFTLVFSVAWWSFLIFWYSMAFSALFAGEGVWLMIVFPLLHVAAGAYIAYLTLCGFLNKTFIETTHYALLVRHAPLPWMGAVKLPCSNVKQLYTIQHHQSGRNGDTITYRVLVVTTANKSVTLVRDLETAQHGLFIERKIENFLGIENQKVEGEYDDKLEQPQNWFV